jgi:hypothetical protein
MSAGHSPLKHDHAETKKIWTREKLEKGAKLGELIYTCPPDDSGNK